MANANFGQKRYVDLSGGLNLIYGDTQIDDNQCRVADNWTFQGNKLVTIPGFEQLYKYSGGNTPTGMRGLLAYGEWVFGTYSVNGVTFCTFFAYNTTTGSVYSFNMTNASGYYNMAASRITSDIIIAVTETTGAEDARIITFNPSTHAFTTPSITGFTGKPTCCGFYEGKLFFGGIAAQPNTMYYSRTWSAGNDAYLYDFSAYNSSAQQVGDGSPITGFKNGQNNFYIFKANSVWVIDSQIDDGANFGYITKPITATGAVSQGSICNVMQDLFYFDGDNVRRLSYEQNTLALKDSSISEVIFPLIHSLPREQTNITSCFSYPLYKLFLRNLDVGVSSKINNIALVYNVETKSWSTQSGLFVSCAAGDYNKRGYAYLGGGADAIVYKDLTTYSYAGGNIQTNFLSKAYDGGDKIDYKRFRQVEIQGKITPGMTVYFDIYVNNKLVTTREIVAPAGRSGTTGSSTAGVTLAGSNSPQDEMVDYRYRYELFHDGRTYQFGVRSETQGLFELHSHHVTYSFVKPYDIHY